MQNYRSRIELLRIFRSQECSTNAIGGRPVKTLKWDDENGKEEKGGSNVSVDKPD